MQNKCSNNKEPGPTGEHGARKWQRNSRATPKSESWNKGAAQKRKGRNNTTTDS